MGNYYVGNKSDKEYYLSLANRPKPKASFSQYRGVSKTTNPRRPYRVSFKYKGRIYYIGTYATELEAAEAYNKAASAVIGDFALLNELPQKDSETKPPTEPTEGDLPGV
jgi:hypothetical protein